MQWLLAGDVSVQYAARKYLLSQSEAHLTELRLRIQQEGWGRAFLEARNASGHWGRGFYQVKWISTHYTLLDLRHLEIAPAEPILAALRRILRDCRAANGSITESAAGRTGDVCVNGMFLNYASFFGVTANELQAVVDYILDSVMPDGGFNCELGRRPGVVHSSMHTTISVLEGIQEFLNARHTYRAAELKEAAGAAEKFLLRHRLFKSDRTGEVIDKRWTLFSYPPRWRYDVLRALVYFADSGSVHDERMDDALALLLSKQRKDGTWSVQNKHPGRVHFDMETTGGPSRINTLRALRVLRTFCQ